MEIFRINIQLFAQEKSEQATPKKQQDARKKGQVAKSKDINSAVILIISFFTLKVFASYILVNLKSLFETLYSNYLNFEDITPSVLASLFEETSTVFFMSFIPIAGAALIAGVAISAAQVGFIITTEQINFKIERINPIEGFKRIFSKRSLVELLKSLFKIFVITLIVTLTLRKHLIGMPGLYDLEINQGVSYIGSLIMEIVYKTGMALIILSILDYIYQKWEFSQSLKMSKHEVKQEYKQTEGDPLIKGKIKEKQRAMAAQRMMQEIPKADVIITNPTHYAIAIKYDENKQSAPIVVAKGKGYVALQIKDLAKDHKVYTFESPPLARGLYESTEIGQEIPEKYYQAVAEILAFVYNLEMAN